MCPAVFVALMLDKPGVSLYILDDVYIVLIDVIDNMLSMIAFVKNFSEKEVGRRTFRTDTCLQHDYVDRGSKIVTLPLRQHPSYSPPQLITFIK